MNTPQLTPAQIDRAVGVLLVQAAGDALGVHYEGRWKTWTGDDRPQMLGIGLGNYKRGEFSDDTQMSVAIALAIREGADLHTATGLDRVAEQFINWRVRGASDIGIQTGNLIGSTQNLMRSTSLSAGKAMWDLAARYHHDSPRSSAGNGSLMRTGIVALPYLTRTVADNITAAARVSALTHADPSCQDACVIWNHAIRVAVLEGTLDGVHDAIEHLPTVERRNYWTGILADAEKSTNPRGDFSRKNGWVVAALQCAWWAITNAEGEGTAHLVDGLNKAVMIGGDTDTIAAIAGQLLGALHGASALPAEWRSKINGWPSLDADGLQDLAMACLPGSGATIAA